MFLLEWVASNLIALSALLLFHEFRGHNTYFCKPV